MNETIEERKLKSCPFCGAEPKMETSDPTVTNRGVDFFHEIRCTNCMRAKAIGRTAYRIEKHGRLEMMWDGVKDACDAWNRRAGEKDE